MRPKTDLHSARPGLFQWLRNAGLKGLAIVVCTAAAGADEAPGRSRLEQGSPLLPTRTWTQRKSEQASVGQPSRAPAYRQSSSGPNSAVPAIPASRTPNSRMAGLPFGETGRTHDWKSDFSGRMDNLIAGPSVEAPLESVGEWWSLRTHQMLNRCRDVGQSVSEMGPRDLKHATQNFVTKHTLPDEIDIEDDVYDSSPKTISAPVIVPVAALDASDEPDSKSTASRLKTDIRSIQPTLSYALKNIRINQLPDDFDTKIDNGQYTARATTPTVLQWAPTNFYHNPLYFEDPALERYGHTYHPLVQPFASSGRFATQLVGLPYQMALHPVCSREYALGYYRPGEFAPKKHYQIPFNEEATLMEVAVLAGLILIIP